MASGTFDERLKKLNDLERYISSVDERVKAITDELNWSFESLFEEGKSLTVSCSVHPEHQVQRSRITEHEERCRWVKSGYQLDDLPLPENHGQGSCVVFTPEIQEMVIRNSYSHGSQALGEGKIRDVPQTLARLDQDFIRDEKLALYDYVIANTKGQKLYKEIALMSVKDDKNEKKVMTPIEIAAAERDAKRRRASYRNKVHTSRKTQTEILREVIQSQMEALKEEISDQSFKEKNERKQCDEPHRRGSYNSSRSESSKNEYSAQGYTHHCYDKSPKKSNDYKHHRKYLADKHSEHKESKHKSKKHKRSRSRERSKHKSKYNDQRRSHKLDRH